jgi:hypothetical protein
MKNHTSFKGEMAKEGLGQFKNLSRIPMFQFMSGYVVTFGAPGLV